MIFKNKICGYQHNNNDLSNFEIMLMKKLNKLQINSDKIMKNEELVALRGGYGGGYCTCRSSNDVIICSTWVTSCVDCRIWCEVACPASDSTVCAG